MLIDWIVIIGGILLCGAIKARTDAMNREFRWTGNPPSSKHVQKEGKV